jgi:hypothetical protein
MRRNGFVLLALIALGAHAQKPETLAFWKWFSAHASELRAEKDGRKVFERINAELEKRHPKVYAEIGSRGGDRLLVFTADGDQKLFPVVQDLYATRPSLPGWKIVAFRQRTDPDDPMQAIEMNGQRVDPKQIKFVAEKRDEKLDVRLFIPGFTTVEKRWSMR